MTHEAQKLLKFSFVLKLYAQCFENLKVVQILKVLWIKEFQVAGLYEPLILFCFCNLDFGGF